MRILPLLLASATLAATFGCRKAGPTTPPWIQGMPANCSFALSGRLGWVVENPDFQAFLSRFPLADQTLDLFLRRARINPSQETARITFMLTGLPKIEAPKDARDIKQTMQPFLIQMGGFRDPKGFALAVTEAFPAEGSLSIRGAEWPLHVIMDVNDVHIRAAFDPKGQLWIGELSALAALGREPVLDRRSPLLKAAEWINAEAPFQGILQPNSLLAGVQTQLPESWRAEIPREVQGLAWSMTPGADAKAPIRFELAVTGNRESITQVTAWLQRLAAAASAVQSPGLQPPNLAQEPTRVGLKAQFTETQMKAVMEKLGQPFLSLGRPPAKS